MQAGPHVLLFALLVACSDPTVSGPGHMVGRVVGPDDRPVGGLQVQSLETSDRTDEAGAFSVPYKDPDQHVSWTIGDTFYRRLYLASDEGAVVEIRLPEQRDATLRCGAQRCDVTLTWALAEGYEARATRRCLPGEEHALTRIPAPTPTVTCRGGSVEPTLDDDGDVLALEPPLQGLRIELRPTEGTAPRTCEVHVGERAARPAGEGFWASELAERSLVTAVCDGRPARPVHAEPDAGSVALEWSPHGPDLDLEEVASWADVVTLEALAGDTPGWSLRLAPSADGVFALPPLGSGSYRLRVDGDEPSAASELPEVDGRPGVLVLRPLGGGESLVGRLDATADLLEGAVPVEGPTDVAKQAAPGYPDGRRRQE